jgi:hypothetical protein
MIKVTGISSSIRSDVPSADEASITSFSDPRDSPTTNSLSLDTSGKMTSKTRNSISNYQRIQICMKKRDNPSITQAELKTWMKETYGIEISQASDGSRIDPCGILMGNYML